MINSVQSGSTISTRRPRFRGACHRAASCADPLGSLAPRALCNLLNQINLMLPVQPHLQKYFHSRLTQITSRTLAVPPTEGRIAIVTDAERDAVDAAAFCARGDRRAGDEPVSDHRAR